MRKKRMILVTAVLLVAMLAGCHWLSGGKEDEGAGGQVSLAGMHEAFEAIKARGYAAEYASINSEWFSGNAYCMVLNDDLDNQIVFYVYETGEAAKEDTSCIDPSGSCISVTKGRDQGMAIVEWVSIPHFYQYENMIVQYIGTDETVLTVLEEICGACFAGGDLA